MKKGLGLTLGAVLAVGTVATGVFLVAPTLTSETSDSIPEETVTALLATDDLGVGENRISFQLLTKEGLIRTPEVTVTPTYLSPAGTGATVQEPTRATFYEWPFGVRGAYVAHVTFLQPGSWELAVQVTNPSGGESEVVIPLEIREETATPFSGSLPPQSTNKTLRDVASFAELTTWSTPDPELYRITLVDAIASGMPSVITFSSPALCSSPTCGPQVDVAQELNDRHGEEANFIHVEIYDNPHEIQGDFSRARYAPIVEEWGLTLAEGYLNESWVFVLDGMGRVVERYQGFVTATELDAVIRSVVT